MSDDLTFVVDIQQALARFGRFIQGMDRAAFLQDEKT